MIKFEKKTFKNGLRAIVVPMKNTEAVTLLVLVGTGSRYENKDIGGISHFLEHLFFKGTKSRPSPGQVAHVLDNMGAAYNAFTSKEYTGFWVKSASTEFDTALDIVSDILLEPIFKKEEIGKERGVIIQEKNMREDMPYARTADILESVLYGDTPFGRDIIGSSDSISNIQRNQIVDYFKNFYNGLNMVAVIAGNVDSNVVFKKVEKTFRALAEGKAQFKEKVDNSQEEPRIKLIEKKTDQMHFAFGIRAYDIFDERKYGLGLLSTVLGGNLSSRLWMEIREKLGLAYYVGASPEHYTDAGYLGIRAGVPHEKLEKVLEKIVGILKAVKQNGVSAGELKNAKSFTRGRFALSLESSDEVAMFFGEQELLLREILQPEEILNKIEKVSKNDILKIESDIFKPWKANLVAIGQHSSLRTQTALYKKIIQKI